MPRTPEDYFEIYEELLGFVPPKIRHRVRLGLEVAPETLDAVEEMRRRVMYPDCLDVKTAQMILFACMLNNLLPAAKIHAIAAKRAGATKEELHAVAGLAFLFRGLSAFNNGAQIINEVFSGNEEIG
jgi:alkylhydroperoxidase/carboxymuconolactone decarboxylase family protein YurZ